VNADQIKALAKECTTDFRAQRAIEAVITRVVAANRRARRNRHMGDRPLERSDRRHTDADLDQRARQKARQQPFAGRERRTDALAGRRRPQAMSRGRGRWQKTCRHCRRNFSAPAGSQRTYCRSDECALKAFAERFHARENGRIAPPWPTVRQAAVALGWTQQKVTDTAEACGEGLMLTSFYTNPPQDPADHYVETI
jgi:hypothetical protein